MEIQVTSRHRRELEAAAWDRLREIPEIGLFPRYVRLMLRDKLVDCYVAILKSETPPAFPPEGFTATFSPRKSTLYRVLAGLPLEDQEAVRQLLAQAQNAQGPETSDRTDQSLHPSPLPNEEALPVDPQ